MTRVNFEYFKLGNIVDCLDSKRVPLNEIERKQRIGDIPYYGANGLVGFVNDYLFDEQLLLLAEDGGAWGPKEKSSYMVFGKSWVNNHAHVLRCKPKVDITYLMNYLNYVDLRKYITGTTRGKLNQNRMNDIDVLFPPLPIQRKIASILEKAESAREKRREANRLTDEFLKSAFLEMFGDPVRNPKGWKICKVEDIAANEKHSIKAGPFGSSLKKEYYVKKGYKIYGQEQVIKDDLTFGDYYISEEKYKTLESNKIKEGDILISLVGTFGKISVVPKKFEPGIINPRLMKITLNQKMMIPIFFKFLLISEGIRARIENYSHGGTMGIVNIGIMKKIKIPVPPISLQQKLADLVQKVEKLKEKQSESEKELNNLFNSLMQRAFRGELV
jgi:type I restriction enzyme S subunit